MRKRIVIGLLILSVIGSAVFFFSQPKKGSVEWHKREYLAAKARMKEATGIPNRFQQIKRWVMRRPWTPYNNKEWVEAYEKMEEHERALVQMGFLAQREVATTGTNETRILTHLWEASEFVNGSPISGPRGSNWIITVTAPPKDLPKWEAFVRKADVP